MTAIRNKDATYRQIERPISSGSGVCASCREDGRSQKTVYRWRTAQLSNSPTPS